MFHHRIKRATEQLSLRRVERARCCPMQPPSYSCGARRRAQRDSNSVSAVSTGGRGGMPGRPETSVRQRVVQDTSVYVPCWSTPSSGCTSVGAQRRCCALTKIFGRAGSVGSEGFPRPADSQYPGPSSGAFRMCNTNSDRPRNTNMPGVRTLSRVSHIGAKSSISSGYSMWFMSIS